MPRLIVFDFDDTLVSSQDTYRSIIRAYCADAGIEEPCYQTMNMGWGEPEAHEFWPGMDREEQQRHLEGVFRYSENINDNTFHAHTIPYLFDETENTLNALQNNGYTLAIITGRRRETLDLYLNHHNMLGHFSAIRSRDDGDPPQNEAVKPAPDQLLSVMRELSFTPDTTLMVGDTTMDIEMARNANVKSVGVTWGCHKPEMLTTAGADFLLDDHLLGLLDLIDTLWPETRALG